LVFDGQSLDLADKGSLLLSGRETAAGEVNVGVGRGGKEGNLVGKGVNSVHMYVSQE
jgi:hypothetical protein